MIGRTLRAVLGTILGVCELARLAYVTRFRLRGGYWRWRTETAFGRGMPASRRELVRRTLAYARWARSIRRMSR